MKNTAAKFVSAVFASIVASSSLVAAGEKEKPADTCLLGPSASTPPGGHWYYRRDRVNKRNCWYLGEAKGKSARKQVAAEDATADEKPAAPEPKKPTTTQRSITDARAEFQPPQTSVEPESKAAATPWPAVTPPVDAQRTEEPRKVVTTRWPEPAAASTPAPVATTPPPPAQPQIAPTQPQTAQAPQQPQPPTQATPVAPPRPAAPQTTPAKATAAADQPLSLPMLLTVLVGGLSVIGVLVSAMFGRGRSRPKKLSRSAPMPPVEAPENPRPQQPRPEQARASDDPTRRLQEMLAEIQKRAAA